MSARAKGRIVVDGVVGVRKREETADRFWKRYHRTLVRSALAGAPVNFLLPMNGEMVGKLARSAIAIDEVVKQLRARK